MLQPQYTMHGFNWFDRRGTEGVGFVRALRTLLTNNLPTILPDLRVNIISTMHKSLAAYQTVHRKYCIIELHDPSLTKNI